MIFGKHINRYYLKYAGWLLLGLASLSVVDVLQLVIPELYRMLIDGMDLGYVEMADKTVHTFDLRFLIDQICMPMVTVILAIVAGRFLWRICFIGSAIRLEADMRDRMFDHA